RGPGLPPDSPEGHGPLTAEILVLLPQRADERLDRGLRLRPDGRQGHRRLVADLPLGILQRLDEFRNRSLPQATQSGNGLALLGLFLAPQLLQPVAHGMILIQTLGHAPAPPLY